MAVWRTGFWTCVLFTDCIMTGDWDLAWRADHACRGRGGGGGPETPGDCEAGGGVYAGGGGRARDLELPEVTEYSLQLLLTVVFAGL